MLIISIDEIQKNFDNLLNSVTKGDNVILVHQGEPVAKLEAIISGNKRKLGFIKGSLPESFFEPLPENEIQAWEL